MNRTLLSALVMLPMMLLMSCQEQDKGLLAQVGEDKLYLRDVLLQMPLKYSADDSVLFVRNTVDEWITEQLLYQQGLRNVQNLEELEAQVQRYRRDLIARTYQAERLAIFADEVSEDECMAFYEKNKSQMRLKEPLIQAVFIKLPNNSTKIKQIKEWLTQMLNGNMDHADELDKFCLERASHYDFFMEQWSDFRRITDYVELKPYDLYRFGSHQVLQLKDGDYTSLILINEFRQKGEEIPFEVCSNVIQEQLIEEKQSNFRKKLQLELRDEALRTGLLILK